MGESVSEKRAALRVLHEQWNVALEALVDISGYTETILQELAIREGWQRAHSTASMQGRLIEVFEQHLVRFSTTQEEEGCEEKRSRALSILAKTLESIAVVGGRIATTRNLTTMGEQKINRGLQTDEPTTQFDANRTADLDRQLAELVQNLT